MVQLRRHSRKGGNPVCLNSCEFSYSFSFSAHIEAATMHRRHILTAADGGLARTAFNQLHYSTLLLLACTFIMIIAFWMPPGFLFFSAQHIQYISLGAFATMIITYLPILLFYGRSPLWALLLPVIGTLYLLMTWTSAMRYWKGEHLRWRGRTMQKSSETAVS